MRRWNESGEKLKTGGWSLAGLVRHIDCIDRNALRWLIDCRAEARDAEMEERERRE